VDHLAIRLQCQFEAAPEIFRFAHPTAQSCASLIGVAPRLKIGTIAGPARGKEIPVAFPPTHSKEATMKLNRKHAVAIVLAFSTLAAAATLSKDPLTGLPLIPATSGPIGGNEPTKIPDSQICKSKVQSEYYPVFNSKVSVTLNWYASRLTGFHKSHAFADGRSQNVFYSADGTTAVAVTGARGKDGEDTETYAVSYTRFQPGLSEKEIIGLNQHNIVCK
jgi:hypothetical protein